MQILVRVLFGILLSMATIAHAEEAKEAAKEAAKEEKNPMVLNTNAFLDKGMFPTMYTCDGKDISPQFSWTGIPTKTKSLALVMEDPDAPNGNFYHWVIYNMPKTVKEIPEGGKTPAGATIGKNSFDKLKYSGPCPPKGSSHTYTITLYALDTKLSLPKGADGSAVSKAIEGHVVGKIGLSTVYSRWIQ
jgi:Raf kinase inhibitor-like YbhB/YbcL family protein